MVMQTDSRARGPRFKPRPPRIISCTPSPGAELRVSTPQLLRGQQPFSRAVGESPVFNPNPPQNPLTTPQGQFYFGHALSHTPILALLATPQDNLGHAPGFPPRPRPQGYFLGHAP